MIVINHLSEKPISVTPFIYIKNAIFVNHHLVNFTKKKSSATKSLKCCKKPKEVLSHFYIYIYIRNETLVNHRSIKFRQKRLSAT